VADAEKKDSAISFVCPGLFDVPAVRASAAADGAGPAGDFAQRSSRRSTRASITKDQPSDGDRLVRYKVGFHPALAEIISEVKYLDELGFDVPHDAKTIALLEDQYVLRVSALKQMLKRFYDVLDQLDVSQVILLSFTSYARFPLAELTARVDG